MTTDTILTPIDLSVATRATGRLWRKQILPEGSINYKGRRIDFTAPKLRAMVDAFDAHAFDSVPLVVADADNRHTMDPRAATGRVVDLEYVPGHGLDMLVRPDQQGEELLSRNPDVGVSARILEGYERADGEHYEAAIQHALITWDPRITGMKPWEVVGLSNEDDGMTVIDLSTLMFVPDPLDDPLAAEAVAAIEAEQAETAATLAAGDRQADRLSAMADSVLLSRGIDPASTHPDTWALAAKIAGKIIDKEDCDAARRRSLELSREINERSAQFQRDLAYVRAQLGPAPVATPTEQDRAQWIAGFRRSAGI